MIVIDLWVRRGLDLLRVRKSTRSSSDDFLEGMIEALVDAGADAVPISRI